MAELANSIDLAEVAQDEPPHLDLHCLPSSLCILNMIKLGLDIFLKFADENFVVCFLVVLLPSYFFVEYKASEH